MNTRSEVSMFRLYLLRAMYAFMALGLAIYRLPAIFNPPANLSTMGSAVLSVLAELALLAVLGIRHPLKMLRKQFRDLARRTAFVGLDLQNRGYRTSHSLSQILLRQIRGFALTPDPGSK